MPALIPTEPHAEILTSCFHRSQQSVSHIIASSKNAEMFPNCLFPTSVFQRDTSEQTILSLTAWLCRPRENSLFCTRAAWWVTGRPTCLCVCHDHAHPHQHLTDQLRDSENALSCLSKIMVNKCDRVAFKPACVWCAFGLTGSLAFCVLFPRWGLFYWIFVCTTSRGEDQGRLDSSVVGVWLRPVSHNVHHFSFPDYTPGEPPVRQGNEKLAAAVSRKSRFGLAKGRFRRDEECLLGQVLSAFQAAFS